MTAWGWRGQLRPGTPHPGFVFAISSYLKPFCLNPRYSRAGNRLTVPQGGLG